MRDSSECTLLRIELQSNLKSLGVRRAALTRHMQDGLGTKETLTLRLTTVGTVLNAMT